MKVLLFGDTNFKISIFAIDEERPQDPLMIILNGPLFWISKPNAGNIDFSDITCKHYKCNSGINRRFI